MARKCREYFAAGVRVVWLVDPETRTVVVHSDPENAMVLGEADTLQGGEVLAGFTLSVGALFAELDQQGDNV
jgi:Uma2 family endonuclease